MISKALSYKTTLQKCKTPAISKSAQSCHSPAGNPALVLAYRQHFQAPEVQSEHLTSGCRQHHAAVGREHEAAVVCFRHKGEMIKRRIGSCVVHRLRSSRYHAQPMLVSPAEGQGKESRSGEHPRRSSWLSSSKLEVFWAQASLQSKKTKHQHSRSSSQQVRNLAAPLFSITFFCCIAKLFNLAQNLRNSWLYLIARILSEGKKKIKRRQLLSKSLQVMTKTSQWGLDTR